MLIVIIVLILYVLLINILTHKEEYTDVKCMNTLYGGLQCYRFYNPFFLHRETDFYPYMSYYGNYPLFQERSWNSWNYRRMYW